MQSSVGTGTILAGFRVESLIGRGATGAVYLAVDTKTSQRVALKLLTPELSEDERFRQRFMREAELAASLDHPHVVPILSFGEEDGRLYLAMAYVEGYDLRELLRRDAPLEPTRTMKLIAQVAGALDAAHAADLVHRDIKPANILVSSVADREHAYVCDFGLARHVSSVSSLTGDRGFVGTLDYVPPEQIAGRPVDGRADVYSLGCVLYECLTGERPFERESELALVYAHLNDPPPRLTDLRPELPEALDGVVATALAKEAEERYASCGELAAAARAALAGKRYARRSRRRRRAVIATVALLAAAAAGIAAFVTTRAETPAAGAPAITQTSIAGVGLGRPKAFYQQHFGGYKELVLTEWEPADPRTHVRPAPDRRVLPRRSRASRHHHHLDQGAPHGGRNRALLDDRRAEAGIRRRPCTRTRTSPAGSGASLGRRSEPDVRRLRISERLRRGLYRGLLPNTARSARQGWANFVISVETPCL